MTYKIVTDSSATLPLELIKEFDLAILPLSYMDTATGIQTPINVFDESFDLVAFYNNMRNGVVYTTSLPNQSDSYDTLVKLLEEGNDLIYIGFDSALSGTCEAVSAIMDRLAEEYPTRKLIHIDTLAAVGAEGLLVYYASRMKQKGASIEEVAQWVNENKLCVDHWFTVEDLKYLLRGGRVSKTSAQRQARYDGRNRWRTDPHRESSRTQKELASTGKAFRRNSQRNQRRLRGVHRAWRLRRRCRMGA